MDRLGQGPAAPRGMRGVGQGGRHAHPSLEGRQEVADQIAHVVVACDHAEGLGTLDQGAKQGVRMDGGGLNFRVGLFQLLEHPKPETMPVLQHIGLVGEVQGPPLGSGPMEGRFQQGADRGLRMEGEIGCPARGGLACKDVRPLGVLPEDLDVDVPGSNALEGNQMVCKGEAGAQVHAQGQILPQPQQDRLGVALVWNARIAHRPKQEGVEVVAQVFEGDLTEGFPRRQTMVGAVGEKGPCQGTAPVPGPGQQGQSLGHHLGPDAVSCDHSHLEQRHASSHLKPGGSGATFPQHDGGNMHLGRTMIAATLAILGLQGAELKEGMPAPSFQALDQHGRTVSLADFRDKSSVILYFYPKDDTPGCTAQACSLRDGHQALQDAGAVVLGVSADDVASHKAFAQKFNLPFSLLADPGKTLIQAYGVAMPVVGMAKRVTFVIDRKGIVRRILSSIDTKNHDDQVLEALKGLP